MRANWVGIVAVALLYALFLAVGWAASRRLKSNPAGELLVAGRTMPLWMATLTMAATWIDGGYLLGTAEGALRSLASGWQGGVCFGLSLILGGFVFARRMRRLRVRHAGRSADGPLWKALGRGSGGARDVGRSVLERRVAGGHRRHVRRDAGRRIWSRPSSFRPRWSRCTPCWAACGASAIPTPCSLP